MIWQPTDVMAPAMKRRSDVEYLRVGAWNVRSMKNKEEIGEEMKKYRLDILGVSETHLRGSRQRAVGSMVMVYSGFVEGRAKGGVAILISEQLSSCLKEWKCENERLMKVRMRIDGKWVTLIQAYTPTEDSEEGLKDSFYDSLEEMIARTPKNDQLVLMGDLNTGVGRDGEAWGGVIGRHGEETKNRNGQRLLSVCAANELVILNTFFQQKDIHKYTWESRGEVSDQS